MTNVIPMQDGRVRLNNEEIKRRISKAIYEGDLIVFQSLPSLVHQAIEHEIWKDFHHDSFADFALDAGSNGLGVNTNQRLWLLRCAMDVHGKHIKEWAEVLAKVETLVRVMAMEEGKTIRSFDGNSLETLAKNVGPTTHGDKITYLPSRCGNGPDKHMLRLRKNHPETFTRVLAGEMSARQGMLEARKKDGERVNHDKRPLRVRSDFLLLSPEEKAEFIEWLRAEGHL